MDGARLINGAKVLAWILGGELFISGGVGLLENSRGQASWVALFRLQRLRK